MSAIFKGFQLAAGSVGSGELSGTCEVRAMTDGVALQCLEDGFSGDVLEVAEHRKHRSCSLCCRSLMVILPDEGMNDPLEANG